MAFILYETKYNIFVPAQLLNQKKLNRRIKRQRTQNGGQLCFCTLDHHDSSAPLHEYDSIEFYWTPISNWSPHKLHKELACKPYSRVLSCPYPMKPGFQLFRRLARCCACVSSRRVRVSSLQTTSMVYCMLSYGLDEYHRFLQTLSCITTLNSLDAYMSWTNRSLASSGCLQVECGLQGIERSTFWVQPLNH